MLGCGFVGGCRDLGEPARLFAHAALKIGLCVFGGIPRIVCSVFCRVAGVVGGILGVLAMRYMPDYPAGDYITAVAVGIVSGFAATGINEAVKQIKQ